MIALARQVAGVVLVTEDEEKVQQGGEGEGAGLKACCTPPVLLRRGFSNRATEVLCAVEKLYLKQNIAENGPRSTHCTGCSTAVVNSVCKYGRNYGP